MSSEYMTSGQLLFLMFVVGLVLLFLIAGKWPFVEFFRWLKGSRMSFFLLPSSGNLEFCKLNMRGAISHSVIELCRGPFRRRSTLYGLNSENWKVAVGHWDVNSIELQDRKGLPTKTALKLVNKYSSLQAMLDRIAELEKVGTEPLAILRALDIKMLDDKQRFRSPAVKEIHANIRFALRELFVEGLLTNPNGSVANWMQRFEEPKAKVIR